MKAWKTLSALAVLAWMVGCSAPGKSQTHITPNGKQALAVSDGEANTMVVSLPPMTPGGESRQVTFSSTNTPTWLTMGGSGTEILGSIPVSSGTVGGTDGIQFTDPSKASAEGITMRKYQPARFTAYDAQGNMIVVDNFFTWTSEDGQPMASPFLQHEFSVGSFNRDIGATLLAEAERQARALVPIALAMEETKRETFIASVTAIDSAVGKALEVALAFASGGMSQAPELANALKSAESADLDPDIEALIESELDAVGNDSDTNDSPEGG